MFGLRSHEINEAFVGFAATIILTLIKHKLLDRDSDVTSLVVAGLIWALHYLIRKIVTPHIPE